MRTYGGIFQQQQHLKSQRFVSDAVRPTQAPTCWQHWSQALHNGCASMGDADLEPGLPWKPRGVACQWWLGSGGPPRSELAAMAVPTGQRPQTMQALSGGADSPKCIPTGCNQREPSKRKSSGARGRSQPRTGSSNSKWWPRLLLSGHSPPLVAWYPARIRNVTCWCRCHEGVPLQTDTTDLGASSASRGSVHAKSDHSQG